MSQPSDLSQPNSGQQPTSSQPITGQQSTQSTYQYAQNPQSGYQPAPETQSGYQQFGYGPDAAAQYGQPGPPQPYPMPAYGYQYPTPGPKRPGIATATGVIGIVLGVGSFGYAAAALIGAAAVSDASDSSNPAGLQTVLWIVGICAVAASVMIFVGAIQILNGSNTFVLRIGSALALIAIWTLAVYALTEISSSNGPVVTIMVGAILASIFPVLILLFSLSSVVSRWVNESRARNRANA